MRGEAEGKTKVRRMLSELRRLAKGYSLDEIKSGEWLARFVIDTLDPYSRKAHAEFFARKYPGRTSDQVIEELVQRAKQHAAIEGALTAGAYTAAVAAIIGTGGAVSLLSVPTGVLAFVTDLFFLTSLQLHLAYDISVLYGHPVDLDDPEEVRDILRVSLGSKPGDGLDLDPAADGIDVADVAQYVTRGAGKLSKRALSVLGKRLLRKALVKLTVPAISIPLASALNYLSAGQTAKIARQVYRDKAWARELAPRLAAAGEEAPELLLESMVLIFSADKRADITESWLLKAVLAEFTKTSGDKVSVKKVAELRHRSAEDILGRLARAPREVRVNIYEAVSQAAKMDHVLRWRERRMLKRLAKACGVRR